MKDSGDDRISGLPWQLVFSRLFSGFPFAREHL